MVDAGGDERLEGVRDAVRRPVPRTPLDEHADRLLDEERVALGSLQHLLRERRRHLARRARELGDELLDQELALLHGQRLELDRRRADAASSPPRPGVEELRAGEAEDQQRRPHPVGEVLDEVDQRLLGPVDVLEEEHERLDVRERLHHLSCGPRDLLRAALALERLQHPGGEAEHVGDGLLLAALPELREGLLERVVVGDPRGGLDHLRERPVRDAFAVGKAAAGEDARALEPVDELAREPALPHAGLAEDREEVSAAVSDRPRERVLEQLELRLAPDERCARAERAGGAFDRVHDAPRAQRPVQPLELERTGVLDDEAARGQAVCRRPEQDLARPRRLLESRREVDGLAGDEGRVGVLDDDLSRLDPDPRLEPELADRVAHGERGLGRALRVVLVRLRHAERGEDGVPGELLDDPAVEHHAVGDHVEEAVDPPPHDLGVATRDEARRVDDVDEQHCCELSLHTRSVETQAGAPLIPFPVRSHALASAAVLDPAVFKAYDVRGVHPVQLDEDGAYRIGRAYVEHFEPRTIAVGRDMRVSSPAMAAAAIEGAADGGADVLDIGLVGTEMVYHAVGELGLDGGICVTASHNPGEYTGMKIVRRGALPVGGDSGLEEIRARALAGFGPVGDRGEVREENVWPSFVEKVLSFVDAAAIRPLRVVVDAANGMAGVMLPPVLERLPQLDVVRCYFEPDGTFPNHEPNPLLPENREFIVRKTREESADLGVAFDGDADRCFFVDDTGEFVPGDFVTALLAEAVLEREPGAKVIYDVRASRAVPETIERAGGVPLVNRVGHAFIKQRMRKEGATSPARSPPTTTSATSPRPTRASSRSSSCSSSCHGGRKLSELLAPFRERFFLTGEINTPVEDVPLKLQELKERYAAEGGQVSHLDGISIDFDDWHFNVRPSNTEPLLRLNLEAFSQERMEEKRDEVLDADPRVGSRGGRPPRARSRHRPQTALQVLGARARVVLGHGRAGHRLLRPLPPLLRPRPHRVPPPPQDAPFAQAGGDFVMRALASSTTRPPASTTSSRRSSAFGGSAARA